MKKICKRREKFLEIIQQNNICPNDFRLPIVFYDFDFFLNQSENWAAWVFFYSKPHVQQKSCKNFAKWEVYTS